MGVQYLGDATHFEGPDVAKIIASVPRIKHAGGQLALMLAEVYRVIGFDPNSCLAIQEWMDAISESEDHT